MQKTILIQNYHPQGTMALIRDFREIGFRVVSPDSDWGRIRYFSGNEGLGGELVSQQEYSQMDVGFVLIGCKAQEDDLKAVAVEHGDRMVLNIAQQNHVYEPDISNVLICPEIGLWNTYPGTIRHRLLYFPRPVIVEPPEKDVVSAFENRTIASYISMPTFWKRGLPAFEAFRNLWPGACYMFGHQAANGMLSHEQCNAQMAQSFFTAHFKDEEAYGLSCLESMMLGTPVVSTHEFMDDKTLGQYFLKSHNSVVEDTVEQAVERLLAMSLDEYRALSRNARDTVLNLTSRANTTDRLRLAMQQEYDEAVAQPTSAPIL